MNTGNDFGFTNDRKFFEQANAFREAAIADGWVLSAPFEHEPATSYGKLTRDGWVMQICSRDGISKAGKWRYECSVHIWGPDNLQVRVPGIYDFAEITSGATRCDRCGATGVKTVRYSFAGRCCEKCRPEMQRQHEQPGWCE